MKSVNFPEQTTVIAKDQKEYNPLPAHVEGGVVTSCWEPDAEDIKRLAMYGKLYVSQLTFGGPLQPLTVQTVFNPPKLSEVITQAPKELEHKQVTDPHEIRKLHQIAELRGLSGPILFAMDNKSMPGKIICHFVRMETQVFDDTPEFDRTNVTTLHPDSDPRLPFLADCFTVGQRGCIINLLKTLKLCADALEIVCTKVGGLPPPLMQFFPQLTQNRPQGV